MGRGRPKGYVVSEETKRKQAETRAKNRVENPKLVKEKPVKTSTKVLSEEHLRKLKEGRQKARQQKIEAGIPLRIVKKTKVKKAKYVNGLPLLVLNGEERDAFDYFDNVRTTLRSLGDYHTAPVVCHELAHKTEWQNKLYLMSTLRKYFTVEVKERA